VSKLVDILKIAIQCLFSMKHVVNNLPIVAKKQNLVINWFYYLIRIIFLFCFKWFVMMDMKWVKTMDVVMILMNVCQVLVQIPWNVRILRVHIVVLKDVIQAIHGRLNMPNAGVWRFSVEPLFCFVLIEYVDIDECALFKHNCTYGHRCENMPGSYR